MGIQEDLPIAYHQQDTDYYCGAACAQMVLDGIGTGLLDQNALYADNHSHSTIEGGWATAPDGLQWTLNDRRPAGFPGWFALFALTTEDAISRKLCWTIHHYRVGPVALVYGYQHWIVIRGYDASAAPANSYDSSYSINAFFVNNPWPPTPSTPPPPPHSGADGCGTGGMRGVADEHITYATWQADYMTGVPAGHWMGQFVAVCDPEPPTPVRGQMRQTAAHLRGDRLIQPADATQRAVEGLKEYGLLDRDSWKTALAATSPGHPVLVQRLDRLDSFYYIVPMQTGEQNRVPVAVSVDARFGQYRQSIALRDGGAHVLPMLDRNAVIGKVVDQVIDLGDQVGRIPIRPEAHCLYPILVWEPCRESLSPFYPFYMFTIGAYRLYVRIDGAVFTQLHTFDRGI
jgi:hypothetical protein